MTGLLKDAVVLVTGGGRGLGRAIAERLAREGAAVAVSARSEDQVEEVAAAIRRAEGRAMAVPCDVTDEASVKAAVEAVQSHFGPVTVLVNNAGISGPIGPIGSIDVGKWWQTQTVHVLGAMLCMSAAIPGMVAAGGGRIINVCSQAGTFVAPFNSAYCVAKATLIRLTEHVQAEHGANGIFAFPIQPGTIMTDMSRETLASPQAEKWAAPLVGLLNSLSADDSAAAMHKLQDFAADLALGRWDRLAGRYLDVDWDLEALLNETGQQG